MADGEEWWSTIAVVPDSSASRAPSRAECRMVSRSRARSSRHHTSSRTSRKLVGVRGGAGMPRASAEYRWWWEQTSPLVVVPSPVAPIGCARYPRRMGNEDRHSPSRAWRAAATAPAVGTRPISPTPLIP
jgi:hypothetical protein